MESSCIIPAIGFPPQVDANVMVVMDSFALRVEGTETRVNAQAQGYEYMTAYIESAKQVSTNLNHQSYRSF